MTRVPDGPVGEDVRLRRIAAIFAGQTGTAWTSPDGLTEGTLSSGADTQDDCAVVDVGEASIVIGSDYVRGAQFFLFQAGLLNYYDIGWYLSGANISDVAAMGASPMALLSVIRYPHDLPLEDFTAIIEGIRDGCSEVGALNVGGDIGTANDLILSGTATGLVTRGHALLRSGARPGDAVFLSGATGLAGAALKHFRAGGLSLTSQEEGALLRPWRRIAPRVSHGSALSRDRLASACIDTSDGLKGSVEAIARSSHVGITLLEEHLPVDPLVRKVADATGSSLLELVLGDSVDFELLFTVRPEDRARATATLDGKGLSHYLIGYVTSEPGLRLEHGDGSTTPLPGAAWNHL